jgi:hypothetical protein
MQANEIKKEGESTSFLIRKLTRSGTAAAGGRKKLWRPDKIKLNKQMIDMMSVLGEST